MANENAKVSELQSLFGSSYDSCIDVGSADGTFILIFRNLSESEIRLIAHFCEQNEIT